MNYLFLNTNFALKLQGKCRKHVKTHLSVTIKRLTRYKQEVVLAAMWRARVCPPTWQPIQNHTTLLKNQSAIKDLP